jgi:hypothetical protein
VDHFATEHLLAIKPDVFQIFPQGRPFRGLQPLPTLSGVQPPKAHDFWNE